MSLLHPSISVVIPCFNETKELLTCINSTINQSVLPKEIIIVDDASTNHNTKAILNKLEKNQLIKVYYNSTNSGPGISRNFGIEKSASKWILLVDSDDILRNNAIEILAEEINKKPESDFFFWNYQINDLEKKEVETISTKCLCFDDSSQLDPYKLAKNFILLGCSPFKKTVWETVGGYDENLSKGGVEDIDFWRRIIFNGGIGYHIDATLYEWNKKPEGNNSNIDEYKYLIHRKKMIPLFDKYNPKKANELRNYVYRYYSSRLMTNELNTFVRDNHEHFSFFQVLKAKLMPFQTIYKIARVLKNNLRTLSTFKNKNQ